MVRETLLESDIEAGKVLIRELDARGFAVTAAMWLFDSDVGEWQLLLASQRFDTEDRRVSYSTVFVILTELGEKMGMVSIDSIRLLFKNNPLLKWFQDTARVEGIATVRVRSRYASGIYVQDAILYRNVLNPSASNEINI